MISYIIIKNYALIDKLEITFKKGFTVITGETGSGKSVLISSLKYLFGAKIEPTLFHDKSKKIIIEGQFNIDQSLFKNIFNDNNIDFHTETIIRREFSYEGRSRSFINDTPVKIEILKNIYSLILDIHSQHENLLLKDNIFQIKLIDSYASKNFKEFKNKLRDYSKIYLKFKDLESELFTKKKIAQTDLEFDYFNNLIKEFVSLNLEIGEKENLLNELALQENIQNIKLALSELIYKFDEAEDSILSNLNFFNNKVSNFINYDNRIHKVYERLSQNAIDMNDILSEVIDINQSLNYDESRLNFIKNRLDSINNLERKLNVVNYDALFLKIEQLQNDISNIKNLTKDIEIIEDKIFKIKNTLKNKSEELTFYRKKSAINLVSQIESDLTELGISHPKLIFEFSENEGFQYNGIDKVSLLFSANKGKTPNQIVSIASGGEISRLMLCFKKQIFSSLSFPCIIFDEIDSGVSGEIARKMGRIIKNISVNGQVICVTHMSQIASLADNHHCLIKDQSGNSSCIFVKELNYNERVTELARMLSGDEIDNEAIANAKKMIDI